MLRLKNHHTNINVIIGPAGVLMIQDCTFIIMSILNHDLMSMWLECILIFYQRACHNQQELPYG